MLLLAISIKIDHVCVGFYIGERNKNVSTRINVENCKKDLYLVWNTEDRATVMIMRNMSTIYNSIKICPYGKQMCNFANEGLRIIDVENALQKSMDYNESLYLWKVSEDAAAPVTKSLYSEYARIVKSISSHDGDQELSSYTSQGFAEKVDELWREIKPLYFELHRYVGQKLKDRYGINLNYSDGYIPAHLLGTLKVDNWLNLYDLVKPHPEVEDTITNLYNLSQEEKIELMKFVNQFYLSVGLEDAIEGCDINYFGKKGLEHVCNNTGTMTENCEVIRTMICNKSESTLNPFLPFYQMTFLENHAVNRKRSSSSCDGFNTPLLEGLGDMLSLLSLNPLYLKEYSGLSSSNSEEEWLNFLMMLALKKIVFLSYSVADYKWKWDIVNSKVESHQSGSRLWHYRKQIQKVKSPFFEETLLDINPASMENLNIINYFLASVAEFQLYMSLCFMDREEDENENSTNLLHTCELYGSEVSGQQFKIREIFETSGTKDWSEILFYITGDKQLTAEGIMDFFEPLYSFLKEQNGPMTKEELYAFLDNDYEEEASSMYKKQVLAEWESSNDINNSTKQDLLLNVTLQVAEFEEHYRKYYFQDLDEDNYEDEFLKRQVEFLTVIGNSALDTDKLSELTNVTNTMSNMYSTAKVCPFRNKNCKLELEGLSLEPDIEKIMASSTDYDELLYFWEAWRNVTGTRMKDMFSIYVNLSNEAALENGFTDMAEMWVSDYESDSFGEDMEKLWQQVKPLYEQLHQYVANRLKMHYGNAVDLSDNLIPAHLLGNMWAQTWINIRKIVRPFPEATDIDVTSALLRQNYTVLKMFETSDDFYQSLGLEPAAMSYSNTTIIQKPIDREVQCHGSAWDFYDRKDFRIRMCTNINYEDFVTIHHEMGHIQYYMLYKNQPISFRNGANPGFHEAIGDVITLSVITPEHLKKIGLLSSFENSYELSVNSLMDTALDKIAFLPFGYLIDKWRWDVFKGVIPSEKWNSHWWKYRKEIQKVKAPVERHDEVHFDPGAKFHVPNDYQYISYFVAHILQFQLYRSFCILSGEYNPKNSSTPLHNCDFYNSTAVGNRLRAGLSLGASKHWKEVLNVMSNETDYDASALMEYFDPLYQFLVKENKKYRMTSRFIEERNAGNSRYLKYVLLILVIISILL